MYRVLYCCQWRCSTDTRFPCITHLINSQVRVVKSLMVHKSVGEDWLVLLEFLGLITFGPTTKFLLTRATWCADNNLLTAALKSFTNWKEGRPQETKGDTNFMNQKPAQCQWLFACILGTEDYHPAQHAGHNQHNKLDAHSVWMQLAASLTNTLHKVPHLEYLPCPQHHHLSICLACMLPPTTNCVTFSASCFAVQCTQTQAVTCLLLLH